MRQQTQHQEKPFILLVDDHPNNLVALEAVLGTSDYHLVAATSGAEALDALEKHDFALILLDIFMPDMDGYEVARRIKASPRTQHIPVILITAIYREDPFVVKAYEVGAVEYFSKPFNPDILRLKVGIYSDLYKKNLVLQREREARREAEARLHQLNESLEERERVRRKDQERLAAELRTILESIPDAIYVGDENGITRCNRAALEMFGLESCEELNQHFAQLAQRIHMRYADSGLPIPPHDQPLSHALRGEPYYSNLLIRHYATQKDLTLTCAAAPMLFERRVIGAVVINTGAAKEAPEWTPSQIKEPNKYSGTSPRPEAT